MSEANRTGAANSIGSIGFAVRSFDQMLLQVNGSFDVPVGHAELSSTQLLKVGRLRMNEELVDGWDFDIFDQS
jgi:hypothetical protein